MENYCQYDDLVNSDCSLEFRRKGVKQRFPELVEKEYFLVEVDFIAPILDQSGKEFSQIFFLADDPQDRGYTLNLNSITSPSATT